MIVHHVQQVQYEMETHERQHQQMHVVHVQQEATVHERQTKQHVEQENGVVHEQNHQQIVKR